MSIMGKCKIINTLNVRSLEGENIGKVIEEIIASSHLSEKWRLINYQEKLMK